METSIIELKESDSIKGENEKNGTYTISTKNSLILNDGDELVIKNAFIDTIASSGGLIVIEDDFTVSIDFCRGFTYNTGITGNSGTTPNTLKEQNNNGYLVKTAPAAEIDNRHKCRADGRNHSIVKGDGLSYFQLDPTVVTTGSGNFLKANTITFVSDYSDNSGKDYGGVMLELYYKSPAGDVSTFGFQLSNPTGNGVSGKNTTMNLSGFEVSFDTDYKGDPDLGGYNTGNGIFCRNSPSDLRDKHHVNPNAISFGTSAIPAGDIYSLKKETISFTITKGAYDPNQLARIITDNMVQMNQTIADFDSSILSEKPFSSKIYDYPNNRRTIGGNFFFQFICETSQVLLTLEDDVNNKPLCGCNQFSFVFDSDTETFKFVSLHSPYYIDTGTAGNSVFSIGQEYSVDSQFVPPPATNFKTAFIDSKQGEIIILGLSAVNTLNEPVDFWFSKLGLDRSVIVNKDNHKSFGLVGGNQAQVPLLNYQNGVNSTNVLRGVDSIFPKGSLVGSVSDFTANSKLVNLMTTAIFGSKTLGQITDSNGYFLIKITGYNNDSRIISSSDIDVGMSSIVSRYYASTAYTNAYESDSIVYIHNGESITISDFTVSILDPDKKPSADIGNNSSVFLMINRAEPIEEKK